MKALTLDAENRTATVSSLPMPTPGPNELLIAVKAVALNHIDAHYTFQPLGRTGSIIGSDFAGLVVARGPPAPSSNGSTTTNGGGGGPSRVRRSSSALAATISRGDRVAGFFPPRASGAFAEYVVCPADLVWRIPGHVTFEEAAGVSLCALAAAQRLFLELGGGLDAPFQWDDESDEAVLRRARGEDGRGGDGGALWFLVAGAATSVGMYAAQLVRRSAEMGGRRVRLVGTAGRGNWDMLRAEPYGYKVLVDYRDTSWPDKVRRATGGGVHLAYGAVSEASLDKDVRSTLRQGGRMTVVRSNEAGVWDGESVVTEPEGEGLGEDTQAPKVVGKTSSSSKRSFATAFYKWLSDGGLLQPNPVRIMPGSFHKVVEDGFSLLETPGSGRSHDRTEEHMRPISGEKLVYRVEGERRGSRGEGHIA